MQDCTVVIIEWIEKDGIKQDGSIKNDNNNIAVSA